MSTNRKTVFIVLTFLARAFIAIHRFGIRLLYIELHKSSRMLLYKAYGASFKGGRIRPPATDTWAVGHTAERVIIAQFRECDGHDGNRLPLTIYKVNGKIS